MAVALAWQLLLSPGRSLGQLAALALAVWLIYTSDRWLDARSPSYPATARHGFAHQHRQLLGILLLLGFALELALVLTQLSWQEITLGLLLLALALAHLALAQIRPSFAWPKEWSAGLVFASGVCLPAFIAGPTSAQLAAWILLAGLCVWNCTAIEVWERGAAHVHPWSLALAQSLPASALALLSGSAFLLRLPLGMALALALSSAAAASCLLAFTQARFSRPFLRMAADLALLLPPLLAWFFA